MKSSKLLNNHPLSLILIIVLVACIGASCSQSHQETQRSFNTEKASELRDALLKIVNNSQGTVGIAFVSAHDTICINNGVRFPMMSVFKLHQALAVINTLERSHASLDTLLSIHRSEIDENTWSPMLKDCPAGNFNISVRDLIGYALKSSDNNASNILFRRIASPQFTDRYIKSIAQDSTFSISYSESEMKDNPILSYSNFTSPLSAALLIKQVLNDSICTPDNKDYIKNTLAQVTTGHDRLGSVVKDSGNLFFAHKTGSGYRNRNNELIAHNDVGYFRLSDNNDYSLAVLIRDFYGTEVEASRIISSISYAVYSYYISTRP